MAGGHRKAEAQAELQRRDANTYLAGRATDMAEERRQGSERQLGIEEGLLGTDAQVSGQLGGVSAELLPYLSRYQFDSGAAALKTDAWNAAKRLGTGFLQNRTDQANALLAQAEQAARAGDFTAAEKLKAQAASGLTAPDKAFGTIQNLPGLDQIFSLVEDPAQAARARLGSPTAQIVGKQVQESQQFQDFDSAASINERRILSESGERAIAAQERGAMRQNRQAAMTGGAAQSAYGQNLANQNTARNFGQDRAQLYAGVAQQFQTMQRQYAKDTVSFAQSYLQNTDGIRDNFQNALDQLKSNFAQLSQQTAQMNQQMAQFDFQRADAEQARADARTQRYQDMMLAVAGISIGAGAGAYGAPPGQKTQGALSGASQLSGALSGGDMGAAAALA